MRRRFMVAAVIAATISIGGMTANAKHVFADGCAIPSPTGVGVDSGGSPPLNGRTGICLQVLGDQSEAFVLTGTNLNAGTLFVGQSVGVENFPLGFKVVPGYHFQYVGPYTDPASGVGYFAYQLQACVDIDLSATCAEYVVLSPVLI